MAGKKKETKELNLLGKILAYPLLAANILLAALLAVSAFCPMLAPVGKWPILSLSGLAFPFLALANMLFLIFWLFVWKRGAWVPAAALALTAVQLFHYCPVHFTPTPKSDDLVIVSYNTEGFALGTCKDRSQNNPVLENVCNLGASIICLQEASADVFNSIQKGSSIDRTYPYRRIDPSSGQACISKYPILCHEIIDFGRAKGNKCEFMAILLGNDTLALFNCHMQSNSLRQEDFNESRQNKDLDSSMKILKKLLNATSLRASQAELVAGKAREYKLAIVLGDFNDSPLSYAHRQFDRFMSDCFAKAGTGAGFTYHKHKLYYRIDHIFCNSEFTPTSCRVDRKCKYSDHYPIIAGLERKASRQ